MLNVNFDKLANEILEMHRNCIYDCTINKKKPEFIVIFLNNTSNLNISIVLNHTVVLSHMQLYIQGNKTILCLHSTVLSIKYCYRSGTFPSGL